MCYERRRAEKGAQSLLLYRGSLSLSLSNRDLAKWTASKFFERSLFVCVECLCKGTGVLVRTSRVYF